MQVIIVVARLHKQSLGDSNFHSDFMPFIVALNILSPTRCIFLTCPYSSSKKRSRNQPINRSFIHLINQNWLSNRWRIFTEITLTSQMPGFSINTALSYRVFVQTAIQPLPFMFGTLFFAWFSGINQYKELLRFSGKKYLCLYIQKAESPQKH